MSEEIKTVRGIRDLLPDELKKWHFIEKQIVSLFESFGFEEIRIPVIEEAKLFQRGVGTYTDIIQKEMYVFQDKKGRVLALRPEATASVVRAYVEHRFFEKKKIQRFYYSGPMFRYDRPQKGRYRQFYQTGVEIFGGESACYDGEIILLLGKILEKIGLKDYVVELNSIGCDKCKPLFSGKLRDYLLKKVVFLCPDCNIRIEHNVLRVLDCKTRECREILQDAPKIGEFLCEECKKHTEDVCKYLKMFSVPFTENTSLVRGLDYYIKTVFEVKIKGDENAVAGGGRYNNLVSELGGPPTPAVGFAIGMDRLCAFAEILEKEEVPVWVVFLGEEAFSRGMLIVDNLRKENIKTVVDYDVRSLKNYLKIADKQEAEKVLILGQEELSKEVFLYKNMKKGTQEFVPFNDIVGFLRKENDI